MKIGYSTWGMPNTSIDEALAFLKGLGFDGVEITVLPRWVTVLDNLNAAEVVRIRELLQRHELDCPAIAGHTSLLSPDAQGHAENWRRLTGAVDLCVEWGGKDGPASLDTTLGSGPDSWDNVDFILERVAALVDYSAPRGVLIGLEPHIGDGLDHPDMARELIDKIDSSWCRLNLDISHFDIRGFTTAETVATLGPYAVHTHMKDQRGRVPDYEFLIPGEGPFDYVEFLLEMEKVGYDGYITAEVSGAVQSRPDYDPMAGAELCYKTLSDAFEKAGVKRG